VVNRSINALKKRRLILFDQIPGADDLTDQGEGIDMDDMQLEVKRVNNCMMQLPVGYRLVLSLYLLEGYDHGEIGQILNITESTSKSQYNRGKEKLRELLKMK
jgi:RNA polymerase sigma-70 factor (ECF subfamily)